MQGEKGWTCATDGECNVYKQLLCIKQKCREEWPADTKINIQNILKEKMKENKEINYFGRSKKLQDTIKGDEWDILKTFSEEDYEWLCDNNNFSALDYSNGKSCPAMDKFIKDKIVPIIKDRVYNKQKEITDECINTYCLKNEKCKKTELCDHTWCKLKCQEWVRRKENKPYYIRGNKTISHAEKGILNDEELTEWIERLLEILEKIGIRQNEKKDIKEVQVERQKAAFCQEWREKSPEDKPYFDSKDGLSVKPVIDKLGSGWYGIEKEPTKEDCLHLEWYSIFKKEDKIIEEKDAEMVAFPGQKVDLAKLQGFHAKDEPIGSSLDYEKHISSSTDINDLGFITSYPKRN